MKKIVQLILVATFYTQADAAPTAAPLGIVIGSPGSCSKMKNQMGSFIVESISAGDHVDTINFHAKDSNKIFLDARKVTASCQKDVLWSFYIKYEHPHASSKEAKNITQDLTLKYGEPYEPLPGLQSPITFRAENAMINMHLGTNEKWIIIEYSATPQTIEDLRNEEKTQQRKKSL